MEKGFGIPNRYDEYDRLLETINYVIEKEKSNPKNVCTVESFIKLRDEIIKNEGFVTEQWQFSNIITMFLNYFVPDEISKRY